MKTWMGLGFNQYLLSSMKYKSYINEANKALKIQKNLSTGYTTI